MQIHNITPDTPNINLKSQSLNVNIKENILPAPTILSETKIGSLSAETILELFERAGFTKEEPTYYEEDEDFSKTQKELDREIETLKNRLKNSPVSLEAAINLMLSNGIPVTSINISALNAELNKMPPQISEELSQIAEKDLNLFNNIKSLTESEKINAINLSSPLTFESVYKAKHTASNIEKHSGFEGIEAQFEKFSDKEVARIFYENNVPFEEENFIKYEQLTNLENVDEESVLEFSHYKSYTGGKTIEIPGLLEYDALKKKLDMVEAQVKLTAEAAMNLTTLDINNKPAEELLNYLKMLEQDFLKDIKNPIAQEAVKALKIIENPLPPVFKSIVLEKNLFNIETIATEQIKAKAALGYAPLETVPNAKFGDSFAKVASQLEGVLVKNGIAVNEENLKVASIMSRTGIDITGDNFLEVLSASKKINYVSTHLHPSIAIDLINSGEDILKMPIDELIEKIEPRSVGAIDNLAEHILKVQGSISEGERQGLISLYKSLHRVEAYGGASLGVNVKNDHSLTLDNLLNAADNFSGNSSRDVKSVLESIKTLQTEAALILEKSSLPVLHNIEVMQSLISKPKLATELLDERELEEIKDSIPSSIEDYLKEDTNTKIAEKSVEKLDFSKAINFSKVTKVAARINSGSYSLPINFRGRITPLHMFIPAGVSGKPNIVISIDGRSAFINTETMDIFIKGVPLDEGLLREIFEEKDFILGNVVNEEKTNFYEQSHKPIKELTKQMMFGMATCFTKYINNIRNEKGE